MKISAQDEYGLRILIRLAKENGETGLSIPVLSEMEGLSQAYIAKITRQLRMAGLIESTRGQKGGYVLTRKPNDITVGEIMRSTSGAIFDESFCGSHSGVNSFCTNSVDCSIRSLWRLVQGTLDNVLDSLTLADLCKEEEKSNIHFEALAKTLMQTPQE